MQADVVPPSAHETRGGRSCAGNRGDVNWASITGSMSAAEPTHPECEEASFWPSSSCEMEPEGPCTSGIVVPGERSQDWARWTPPPGPTPIEDPVPGAPEAWAGHSRPGPGMPGRGRRGHRDASPRPGRRLSASRASSQFRTRALHQSTRAPHLPCKN